MNHNMYSTTLGCMVPKSHRNNNCYISIDAAGNAEQNLYRNIYTFYITYSTFDTYTYQIYTYITAHGELLYPFPYYWTRLQRHFFQHK